MTDLLVDDDWEPTSDYDDQMDALQHGLLTYEGTHCVHGTFVGNWAGPDYMCGYCESGMTAEEYEEEKRYWAEANEKRRLAREQWDAINREIETLVTQEDKDAMWIRAKAFLDSDEGQWLFK